MEHHRDPISEMTEDDIKELDEEEKKWCPVCLEIMMKCLPQTIPVKIGDEYHLANRCLVQGMFRKDGKYTIGSLFECCDEKSMKSLKLEKINTPTEEMKKFCEEVFKKHGYILKETPKKDSDCKYHWCDEDSSKYCQCDNQKNSTGFCNGVCEFFEY